MSETMRALPAAVLALVEASTAQRGQLPDEPFPEEIETPRIRITRFLETRSRVLLAALVSWQPAPPEIEMHLLGLLTRFLRHNRQLEEAGRRLSIRTQRRPPA